MTVVYYWLPAWLKASIRTRNCC